MSSQEQINPNDDKRTLDRVLQFGTEEDLITLFDNGMEINQVDWSGRTALMMYSAKGNGEVVEALLRRGADVNQICMYQDRLPLTALDAAIEKGKLEIADILLSHGAMTGHDLISLKDNKR